LAPFAEQSSASLPTLSVRQEAPPTPTSGDSPWANIFDDEHEAPNNTMPADMELTPVQANSRVRRMARARLPQPAESGKSFRLAVILGAALLGFLVGASLLLLLVK
jgi:hypothetical protein